MPPCPRGQGHEAGARQVEPRGTRPGGGYPAGYLRAAPSDGSAPGLGVRQVKRPGAAKARERPIQTHNPGYRPRHGVATLRETFQDDRIGRSLKQHKL